MNKNRVSLISYLIISIVLVLVVWGAPFFFNGDRSTPEPIIVHDLDELEKALEAGGEAEKKLDL